MPIDLPEDALVLLGRDVVELPFELHHDLGSFIQIFQVDGRIALSSARQVGHAHRGLVLVMVATGPGHDLLIVVTHLCV